MPDISVIVPVYKAEAFLRKCTESIRNQTCSDWELLLIEDGSPDESGVLCEKIAEEDGRIRVFHQENGGVSAARNLGLSQAQGTYIAFVDADDWLAPNGLETLLKTVRAVEADTAGCAHFRTEITGETVVEPAAMRPGVYGLEEIRKGIVERLLGQRLGKQGEVLNGFVWRFLFERNIIIKNQITFSGAYLEDELFLLEYFCYAKKLAMTDKPLYYYLYNPASATRRYLKDYMETFCSVMAEKERLAAEHGLGKTQPDWRENSNWAGLLIAVSNLYAPGTPFGFWEKIQNAKKLILRPEMQQAIRTIVPRNLDRNKQIVADLIRRRWVFLLTVLYTLKNRNR